MSSQGTRSRIIADQAIDHFYKETLVFDVGFGPVVSPVIPPTSGTTKVYGTQLTVSESHRFPPPKGSLTDAGGPFFTQKRRIATKIRRIPFTAVRPAGPPGGKQTAVYNGPRLPVAPPGVAGGVAWPSPSIASDDDLEELGATAISLCKPTNSVADVLTAVSEILKDGLPHLAGSLIWKDRYSAARSARSASSSLSDEYLNLQFGLLPLANDITKFADGVTRADAVLAQYERDAGKVVRRNFYFPTKTTRTETKATDVFPWTPVGNNVWGGSAGVRTLNTELVQRRWFSGAFTYYLPSGYDSRNKVAGLALLAQRLGVQPSLNTIWELTPWSWAVDWFSNTGDVISNIQSFNIDGLIMRYGYMMEHTVHTHTYTFEGCRDILGRPLKVQPLTLVVETKRRIAANPFGFGVSWSGLSSFQASILAALGISRSRG